MKISYILSLFCLFGFHASAQTPSEPEVLTYKNKIQESCSNDMGVPYDAKLLQKCEDEKWNKNIGRMCEVLPESNYCREDYWEDPSGPKKGATLNKDVKKVDPLSVKESKYCAGLVSKGKIKRPDFRKCVDQNWEKTKKTSEKSK